MGAACCIWCGCWPLWLCTHAGASRPARDGKFAEIREDLLREPRSWSSSGISGGGRVERREVAGPPMRKEGRSRRPRDEVLSTRRQSRARKAGARLGRRTRLAGVRALACARLCLARPAASGVEGLARPPVGGRRWLGAAARLDAFRSTDAAPKRWNPGAGVHSERDQYAHGGEGAFLHWQSHFPFNPPNQRACPILQNAP